MTQVIIDRFGPRRSWARPGDTIEVAAVLSAGHRLEVNVDVELLDLEEVVDTAREALVVGPGSVTLRSRLELPRAPRHGYGLRLTVSAAGRLLCVSNSAVEALEGWWESPRHAAVTDYSDPAAAAEAAAALTGWNVTVVQHYDWMWRHYRYRPPDGAIEFVDALGRTVSHAAVRVSIAAGHERGIASLAYGSVYGAEPEHVERYPADRVFDERGSPLSLGGAFYINDVRPGSAWRARLLEEYEHAVSEFGFDGIHMDTYGPPYVAVGADGQPIDFAQLYAGLIDEAAERIRVGAPDRRVLFNCVDGFPLEAIAAADAAALYLELWPPDETYADVVRWIDRARAVANGRSVVIAAYAATLKGDVAPADRAAAFEAVPLLGVVIAVAGAYHHTIAEGERLLVEGYYPAAVVMTHEEAAALRALWRFTARYVHLLSDPGLLPASELELALTDGSGAPVRWSHEPSAGSVWVRETRAPGGERLLHLLDLRSQPDSLWTVAKAPAAATAGLRLAWAGERAVMAMTPWTDGGEPRVLDRDGGVAVLPPFRRWLMIVAS